MFFLVFSPTITNLILTVNIFSFRFLFSLFFFFFFNIRLTPHSPYGMARELIHTPTRGFVFLSYYIFLRINLQYMPINCYIFFFLLLFTTTICLSSIYVLSFEVSYSLYLFEYVFRVMFSKCFFFF